MKKSLKRRINYFLVKRLKGGAMQYAIGIALLNVLLILSFLSYVRLRGNELSVVKVNMQLRENVRSLSLLLEENPALFSQQRFELPFLTEELPSYSNSIEIREWGLFYVVKICSKFREMEKSNLFLFTDDIFKSTLLPSLYLSSKKSFMSVCGDTYLGNNTYLPEYGIKRSTDGSKAYTREKLIQGQSFSANEKLPELNDKLINRYNNLMQPNDSLLPVEVLGYGSTITNSFKNNTVVISSDKEIVLDHITLTGNIKIISQREVVVERSTTLKGVIIFSPVIRIKEGFSGNAQFFAKNLIETGPDCTFKAPTVFFLSNKEADGQITMGERNEFIGNIIVPFESKDILLRLNDKVGIVGQIYCNGYVSIKGTILGSLFTKGLISIDGRGKRMNLAEDICIDVDRLPKEFGGVSFFDENGKKRCVDEVY